MIDGNLTLLADREWLSPQQIAEFLGVSLGSAIRIAEHVEGSVDLTMTPKVIAARRIRRHRTLRVPRTGLQRFLHNRKL